METVVKSKINIFLYLGVSRIMSITKGKLIMSPSPRLPLNFPAHQKKKKNYQDFPLCVVLPALTQNFIF